ncbi:MAG: hypothetical protein FWH14_08745 [Oscillospiraceae bacterium]|nr:hypothetical protein [Oscillospiraceae bacterium]
MANTRNKVAIVFAGVVCLEMPSHSVGIWILDKVVGAAICRPWLLRIAIKRREIKSEN